MEVLNDVQWDQQSKHHNDVYFGSLSKKRSSNWRPPKKAGGSLNTNAHLQGKTLNTRAKDVFHYSLKSTLPAQPKQNPIYENNVFKKEYLQRGHMEPNHERSNKNRLQWPRPRHKNSIDVRVRNAASVLKDMCDFNLQQDVSITSVHMANSNLHSACDIHSKCGENHVNGDDFVFRKISNLFFHRNQILWQHNFSKWLNGCTKTLFVGGSTTRFKKTISYFGSASTLMLLLIFSALISGPGEAYPVEGGMYTRTSSLHWQYNIVCNVFDVLRR